MTDKSSVQQQRPVWGHAWMNGETNAELLWGTEFNLGIGNKKLWSRIYRSTISLHSKGRRGENEIKLHRFVLPAGSYCQFCYVCSLQFIVRTAFKEFLL